MEKIGFNQWFIVFNNANSLIKIILFLVIWAGIWLPIAIPIAKLVKWHPAAPISIKQKLSLLTSLYLLVPFLLWITSRIEEVSIIQYGLTWQVNFFKSILFGSFLGIFSVLFIYLIESKLGWLQWQIDNFSHILKLILPLLTVALFVSVIEEIIFRGLFLNFLREDFSLPIATIISSIIFSLLHLVWERENSLPQLPGLFVMGIILVIGRLVDHGNLGIAIGLHAGWIFILSCLDSAELYFYTDTNKKFITGEIGKPLASVAGIIVLLLCCTILYVMNPIL